MALPKVMMAPAHAASQRLQLAGSSLDLHQLRPQDTSVKLLYAVVKKHGLSEANVTPRTESVLRWSPVHTGLFEFSSRHSANEHRAGALRPRNLVHVKAQLYAGQRQHEVL